MFGVMVRVQVCGCIYINLWYVGIGVAGRFVWIMICFEPPIWVVSKS